MVEGCDAHLFGNIQEVLHEPFKFLILNYATMVLKRKRFIYCELLTKFTNVTKVAFDSTARFVSYRSLAVSFYAITGRTNIDRLPLWIGSVSRSQI